jgi:hypothetical protein
MRAQHPAHDAKGYGVEAVMLTAGYAYRIVQADGAGFWRVRATGRKQYRTPERARMAGHRYLRNLEMLGKFA